jgi:K+-sensing histidine kinase KdpD
MERILICMDDCRGAWEALSHAISLGKRIQAVIYVLRVKCRKENPKRANGPAGGALRDRLDRQIEAAKGDGVRIEHFEAKGVFEDEVIRFAASHRVTLLVAELGQAENLQKIRHRIACPVELVSPRWNRKPPNSRRSNP